ncbi:hypothetical protein [Paraflavitalea speifideaquila]|uniref:hypothetical protein n=1 Tax=Paraflavitalea speifideaquila TaxID=3076558 RepID=UPI0028E6B30C|nr:hypothetical protein [Paraflavitalea speifideiaquila]
MTDYQIIKDDPSDWKMLQHFTSSILSDCGFQATTEKVIETVRGAVEVDVYGEKKGRI